MGLKNGKLKMSDQPGNTTILEGLLDRLAKGDESARDELIEHSMDRFQRLARKMLRDHPAVRRWNQTDDVLQNALIRLHRALKTVRPESKDRFVGLAATQIRRELIDLWRHHYGPQGDGAHHRSDPDEADSESDAPRMYALENKEIDPAEQAAMHELVDKLPDELREVFELRFYWRMTHDEIAKAVGVASKTVKRRWQKALYLLEELLADSN